MNSNQPNLDSVFLQPLGAAETKRKSMPTNPFPFSGLSDNAVSAARKKHGPNSITNSESSALWNAIKEAASEPMFLLLVIAGLSYYLLGEIAEALFMLAAILLISAISLYQNTRNQNALAALRLLTAPKAKVIRNNKLEEILAEGIVIGDFAVAEEGSIVVADGKIIHSNDFALNESVLTGESFSVSKDSTGDNKIYQGTLVVSGLAVYEITGIGTNTAVGKIGKSLSEIQEEKSPLQNQLSRFVKQMAIVGGLIFLVIWLIHFSRSNEWANSLIKSLTLAMSILPEEIPVAFATFMAIGAWRLMQKGIIVKQTQTVEALGAASVICVDKTGTITENKMELAYLYIPAISNAISFKESIHNPLFHPLIANSMWASEPVPFDPMEIALHNAYKRTFEIDERPAFKMIHEYPLSGKPPMMTHVFESAAGKRIIAAKGASEAIFKVSVMTEDQKSMAIDEMGKLSAKGYRVLAVACANYTDTEFPQNQNEFSFNFSGLLAFYDPPKHNINSVFNTFYDAGITVKIITGDNSLTTSTIAKQAGLRGTGESLNGEQLLALTDKELDIKADKVNIFTRMFPEAKLRIIDALKRSGHIVAMTGDGVNDAPALKAAHIGIAMGKHGSEVARETSSLILIDDDLERMTDAIAMGRRIYTNLKKAIQYIISIHIPIILTVAIPVFLGWKYSTIFTPVHVIFLELIMGPTCSIIYENEPLEANSMQQPPRTITKSFFSLKELSVSIFQGIVITAFTLWIYYYEMQQNQNEDTVRTMVFITLISANILLTLVNRSFYFSLFTTIKYNNKMLIGMILVTIILLGLLITVPILRDFFLFSRISTNQLCLSLLIGFLSVIWFEVFKKFRRMRNPD